VDFAHNCARYLGVTTKKDVQSCSQGLSILGPHVHGNCPQLEIYVVTDTNSVIPLTEAGTLDLAASAGEHCSGVSCFRMNRLVPTTVLLVLTALPSAQAQMRGGGFRSGAGFGRPAGAVRFGGGISTFRHSPVVIGGRVGFGHNPRVHVFFGSRRVFFRRHFINTFPFGFGGYGYLPYYPYYADYPYTMEPAPSTYYSARNDTSYEQGRIAQELQDLRDEVRALREENAASGQAARQPQPSPEKSKPEPLPPTTLVFRDGRREDVQNYAIVGDTLWILNESRARKRPLADLDVHATKQANSDHGVDFSVPNPRH
jgi:hypothetical protein